MVGLENRQVARDRLINHLQEGSMPRRNLFAILMVGAISLLCWQTTQGARDKEKDEVMEQYGLFVDAVEQVAANYVRPVSRKELLESALRGMLQSLDPHSAYINESDWKQFKQQIEGSFSGIGIQVTIDDDNRLRVIAPLPGTPAHKAGVLAGDVILEIDGKSTEGITIDKATDALKGRPGTSVSIKVLHPGTETAETLTMNRAIIDMPSVLGDSRSKDGHWNYMIDPERKIAYVRITGFIQKTTDELKRVLEQLQEQGMKGLILDLRDNPGGLLSSAVEVSDLFIAQGKIVTVQGRNTAPKTYEAHKEGTYSGFPMAVLINEGSASASEIVAACLQDHGRAAIVGQRSFGKGSVQNIMELEDGNSVLKLTIATYIRPNGHNIHRFKDSKEKDEWGVSPDPGLEVKYTPREHIRWAQNRRDRDLESLAPEAKEKTGEDKAKDESKEESEDKKPFVDRQLEKAIAVVKEKLDHPAQADRAEK
jgi:carboxyl-terminal processing protease